MKEGMDRAREIAERVQAGERAAMRRWLAKENQSRSVPYSNVGLWDMGMKELEDKVKEYGGDPDPLKAEGRKRVVDLITKGK